MIGTNGVAGQEQRIAGIEACKARHPAHTLNALQDIGLIARRTLRRLPRKTRLKFLSQKQRSELAARERGGAQVVEGSGNGDAPLSVQSSRPIVLVLGSGWGAHSLIKVRRCVPAAPRMHACMPGCRSAEHP